MSLFPITTFGTEKDLEDHLRICINSEYRVSRNRLQGTILVEDGKQVVLSGLKVLNFWVLRLNRRYYHHPLENMTRN